MFKRILVFLLQWIVAKAKHVYRILILFRVYHPYNVIVKLTPSGHSFFFLGWSVGIVKWELGFIVFLVWQSDRFIPEKATMDFDLARFMVTRKEKENSDTHTSYPSPSKKAYKKEMATTLFKDANVADNNCRILSFKGKSSTASQVSQQYLSANLPVAKRARRCIPQV